MRLKKVSVKYIRVVQDMYKNSSTQVRTSADLSEDFLKSQWEYTRDPH